MAQRSEEGEDMNGTESLQEEESRVKFRPRSLLQKERRFHMAKWRSVEKQIAKWIRDSQEQFGHSPLVNALWVNFPPKTLEPEWRLTGPEYLQDFWTVQRKSDMVLTFRKGKELHRNESPTGPKYIHPDVEIGYLRVIVAELIKDYAKSKGLQRGSYDPELRPPWWPEHVPYCSPNCGPDRWQMTASVLRSIVQSYNDFYELSPESAETRNEDAPTTVQIN